MYIPDLEKIHKSNLTINNRGNSETIYNIITQRKCEVKKKKSWERQKCTCI